ncbi:MAG: AzlC family ABC transporter permease [Zoogloeaceae bacterium]|nr:AzlC family ABC transporter permease [Zoogloeaceae bacterium]
MSPSKAALPIMLGYLALGVPCGILGVQAGMSVTQIGLLSVLLYSGSGQYMIASLALSGFSPLFIALSVALVNARQLLYASALLPFFAGEPRWRATLAAANVTDESFGVNLSRYQQGGWSARQSLTTNLYSQAAWVAANLAGALLGTRIQVNTALAAFAMTSIFTCLLLMQKGRLDDVLAALGAALAVVACKLAGLMTLAIFLGALAGVACGVAARQWRPKEGGILTRPRGEA